MKTNSFSPADLRGVFAVPPLARRRDSSRSLDLAQNDLIGMLAYWFLIGEEVKADEPKSDKL